jgi:hypothetical protein
MLENISSAASKVALAGRPVTRNIPSATRQRLYLAVLWPTVLRNRKRARCQNNASMKIPSPSSAIRCAQVPRAAFALMGRNLPRLPKPAALTLEL